jgi:hypothetical protein
MFEVAVVVQDLPPPPPVDGLDDGEVDGEVDGLVEGLVDGDVVEPPVVV